MSSAWDPRQIYAEGETVTVGSTTYTSAQNYNFNNAPATTTGWWTAAGGGGGGGTITGVGLSSNSDQLQIASTNAGPSIVHGATIASGPAWLSVPYSSGYLINAMTIGDPTIAIPAPGASETAQISNVTIQANRTYLVCFYVALQNNGNTPVIFDNGVDLCQVYVTGDILDPTMPPFFPYFPVQRAELQFTNFPAGETKESHATATLVFQAQATGTFLANFGCTFTNVSGTMRWAPASANPMVTAVVYQLPL